MRVGGGGMAGRSAVLVERFAPGDTVVRREVLRGEVWFGCPTICVEDSPDLLALYLPPGPSSASRRRGRSRVGGTRGRPPATDPGRGPAS
ncbi:hypothetical protein NKG94_18870 [Micromonospora sp. M12]